MLRDLDDGQILGSPLAAAEYLVGDDTLASVLAATQEQAKTRLRSYRLTPKFRRLRAFGKPRHREKSRARRSPATTR